MELRDSSANIGLNLDSLPSQIKKGQVSFAMNAVLQGFDGKSVGYQNEQANELCLNYPAGLEVIGKKLLPETGEIVLWLVGGGISQIGIVKDCQYSSLVNSPCLNFSINYPIKKAVIRERRVYFTDGFNPPRYVDLNNLPFLELSGADGCENTISSEIDCNKMRVQPNFAIPRVETIAVDGDGTLVAGTYQFAVQYADSSSNAYTSFYSVTNPLSIHDPLLITPNFDYPVSKSIALEISNLDDTGIYDYINLAVIQTVNDIPTVELVGTYDIVNSRVRVVYTGQKIGDLTISDVFEKFPFYQSAQSIFAVQDVLGWAGLKQPLEVKYQKIFNQLTVGWQTHRIKGTRGYKEELHTEKIRGYMRDETYALEAIVLHKNGTQSQRIHIPGRQATTFDLEPITNLDAILQNDECDGDIASKPRWQVYNTAKGIGKAVENPDECYEGPYEYGEFAYTESTDFYPCDEEIWGELANQPIRHHRFPDNIVTNHYDREGYIYPIGIRINVQELVSLLGGSTLTQEEKDNIAGIKIVRGNRASNKRIIAKGHISNVLKYQGNDNRIGSKSTSGSTSSNPTIAIIDSGINMMRRAQKSIVSRRLDDSIDLAGELKLLEIGTPEFTAKAKLINSKLADLLTNDRVKEQEEVSDQIRAALDIFESLSETSILISENKLDADTNVDDILQDRTDGIYFYPNYLYNDVRERDPFIEKSTLIYDEDAKSRYVFHSPDTHFYQPTLGNILKLETVQYGKNTGHIVETKNHAKYQFVNSNVYVTALFSGLAVGFASGMWGVSTKPFDGTAAFVAYQAMLSIIYKVTPKRNFVHQYNSVSDYNNWEPVPNNGTKQRLLDIAQYLIPGKFHVGDKYPVNNWQRESSIYLRTMGPLPYTHEQTSAPQDRSKMLFYDFDNHESYVSSYYASIQKPFPNQWGQVFSYEPVDTGWQKMIDLSVSDYGTETVFGGDVYITKFAYKTKFPFFIDNRVNPEGTNTYADESDIFYNELSNVGRVKYWFSTDATKSNGLFKSIFGVRPHKFFWNQNKFFNDYGLVFLQAYGVPYFWVESEVNTDMRQATNSKEGEFFPHVGTMIPDDWMQESRVTIQHDNVYNYNKTYSKQNKENYFSKSIPAEQLVDINKKLLYTAIYSDKEDNQPRNNWLIYRPVSKFLFPQEYGKLTSIETLEDRAFLARFENKSLLYNVMLTIDTSTPKAAYLGNPHLFSGSPPLDFAETELGYNGAQHAFFLKTEYGHITVDAKRGKVFIITGNKAKDLTDEQSNMSIWFQRNLPFVISTYFPTFDIDNNYKGVGLHGTFNGTRLVLTKLDYAPSHDGIIYANNSFTYGGVPITLDQEEHFCNRSFTISLDLDSGRWISFHSYVPAYYVEGTKQFYSGISGSLWLHDKSITHYNRFYGVTSPYILEHPYNYQQQDEIVQSIRDYTKIAKYTDISSFTTPGNIFFNKCILYNDESCSGLRLLEPKPTANLFEYRKYPKYNADSISIMFTKSDNFFDYNGFWNVVNNQDQPIFVNGCTVFKELNQPNMNYTNRAFKKAPLRGKDLKIRHILDNTDEYRFISQFQITENQPSIK